MSRSSRAALVATAAVVAALGVNCATPTPPHEVERIADAVLDAAEGHLRDGNPAEAGYLAEAVLRIDPQSDRALALIARAEQAGPALRDPLLGSNRPLRVRVARPVWVRALLYLPDRLLDLADVVSIDLHLGFGLYANAHATRALQAAGGARGVTGIGWHERRSLGVREQNDAGLVLGAFGAETTSGTLSGTSGSFAWAETVAGLQRPAHSVYQEVRDYWAIGAAVTLLVFGADLDLHPLQMADFAAGLATADLLADDFASTRALAFTRHERGLLRELEQAAGNAARRSPSP